MADVPATRTVRPRSHWFWPGFLATLLGSQMLLMLAMVYLATRDDSFSTEPDYYQKGLHWNETAAQLRANERLGWRTTLRVGAEPHRTEDRIVELVVRDAGNRPIDGAAVEVTGFAHLRGRDRHTLRLVPAGGGVYQIGMRFPFAGVWEFRFRVLRGADVFTQTIIREIPQPTEEY